MPRLSFTGLEATMRDQHFVSIELLLPAVQAEVHRCAPVPRLDGCDVRFSVKLIPSCEGSLELTLMSSSAGADGPTAGIVTSTPYAPPGRSELPPSGPPPMMTTLSGRSSATAPRGCR
jgi:hypothetical protein